VQHDNRLNQVLLLSFALTNAATQEDISIGGKYKFAEIYPNPVKDVLNIQGLDTQNKIEISLVDLNGQVLAKKSIGTSSYVWNIKSLAVGAYYLHIEEGMNQTTLKFIKQ